MLEAVEIRGRFMSEGTSESVKGAVRFTPQRLWVTEDDVDYATLSPAKILLDGRFSVMVTPTDTQELPWEYMVECPAGVWIIKIRSGGPLFLKHLIPSQK